MPQVVEKAAIFDIRSKQGSEDPTFLGHKGHLTPCHLALSLDPPAAELTLDKRDLSSQQNLIIFTPDNMKQFFHLYSSMDYEDYQESELVIPASHLQPT